MKKKVFLLFILVLNILLICGCGSKENKNNKDKEEPKEETKKEIKKVAVLDYDQTTGGTSSVARFKDGYAVVRSNGKFGVIDRDGNVVVDFDYISLIQYDNLYFTGTTERTIANSFYLKNGKIEKKEDIYLTTASGKIFNEGYALALKSPVSDNSKGGYVDENLNVVIDFKYDGFAKFQNDRAFVRKDKKIYLIDKSGKELTSFLAMKKYYMFNYYFDDELFPAYDGKNEYYINKDGQRVSGYYKELSKFINGRGGALINGKVGFLDSTGKLVIPAIYDYETITDGSIPFESGLGIVRKNGKYGIIDKDGKVIVPFNYLLIQYSGGNGYYYGTLTDHSTIFFDLKGNKYKKINYNEELDVALVCDSKCYYLDSNGNVLFNKKFDEAQSPVSDSEYRYVVLDGKDGYIDGKGEFYPLPENISVLRSFVENNIIFEYRDSGKKAVFNAKYKKTLDLGYGKVAFDIHEDRIFLKKKGKLAILDIDGNIIAGNLDEEES